MKFLCAAETVCDGCPAQELPPTTRELVESEVNNQFACVAWKSIPELSEVSVKGWARILNSEILFAEEISPEITQTTIQVIRRIASGECTVYK